MKKPVLYIQHDWDEVLRDPNGRIWIMCKSTDAGTSTVHGEIFASGSSTNTILGTNNFKPELIHQKCIKVSHEDPNSSCVYFAPISIFAQIHSKSIISLDVCSGGLGVSACSSNTLKIWDTQSGEIRRELQGHVCDVYSCKFFPSGIVVLSGGADMQLKIWSAETGQCAATVIGHTAAITDTAIVERGRNVVSTSKDGSARLWDCGRQRCLDVVCKADSQINCCLILPYKAKVAYSYNPEEREIGTEGKLLAIGCEDGTVRGTAIRPREAVFEYQNSCAVNCFAALNDQLLVGLQNGSIQLIRIHDTSQQPQTWDESTSAVLSICSFRKGFFASRADGTCTYYKPDSSITIQLTGPDCDPVYKIATDGTYIYTACRDSQIRKYAVSSIA